MVRGARCTGPETCYKRGTADPTEGMIHQPVLPCRNSTQQTAERTPVALTLPTTLRCNETAFRLMEEYRSGRNGPDSKSGCPVKSRTRGFESHLLRIDPGEVSEWPKEHAWKACVRGTVPRVRIPPSPPPFSFHVPRSTFQVDKYRTVQRELTVSSSNGRLTPRAVLIFNLQTVGGSMCIDFAQ